MNNHQPDLSIVSDDDLALELLSRATAGIIALSKDGYDSPESRRTVFEYSGNVLEVVGLAATAQFSLCKELARRNKRA